MGRGRYQVQPWGPPVIKERERRKNQQRRLRWSRQGSRGESRVHGILESRGRKCFKEEGVMNSIKCLSE